MRPAITILAALTLGCPGPEAVGGSSSSSSTSSTTSSTGTSADDSGGSSSSSSTSSTTSSTGTSADDSGSSTSSTADPSSSSGSGSSTSSSSSTTGPTCSPAYGECEAAADCCEGECITSMGNVLVRFCSTSCFDTGDCADPPEDGSAPLVCFAYCNLSCGMGQTCPAGMVCNGIHCGWPS